MKRAWLKYTLLGAGTYLVALIATLPAQLAYSLAAPHLPGNACNLYQLTGSIWSGRAGALACRNHTLGALDWQVAPSRLLLGRLALQGRLSNGDAAIEGQAVLDRHALALHDVTGQLPAATLAQFNPGLPIALDGQLSLNLAEVRLGPQPAVEGVVVWNRALLVAGQPLHLGDLKLTLKPDAKGGINGTLGDAGGPLEISGDITLDANRSYRLHALLRARPSADEGLRTGLAMLGRPDRGGHYTLRYNGRL